MKQKAHLFNPLEDHHWRYDHELRDYVEMNKPAKTAAVPATKTPAVKTAAVPATKTPAAKTPAVKRTRKKAAVKKAASTTKPAAKKKATEKHNVTSNSQIHDSEKKD